jgi:hypothetical protein
MDKLLRLMLNPLFNARTPQENKMFKKGETDYSNLKRALALKVKSRNTII